MESDLDRPIVAIITGFGPFRDYSVNPSWLAVRALPSVAETEGGLVVRIETYQIPVQYQQVRDIISDIHDRLRPDIVIHCGVSSRPCYCLESLANAAGYVVPDNIGELPPIEDTGKTLECYHVDNDMLKSLASHLSSAEPQSLVPICVSHNAGRFLCEYSLFQSLRNASAKRVCLFFHVPASAPVPLSTTHLLNTIRFLVSTKFKLTKVI